MTCLSGVVISGVCLGDGEAGALLERLVDGDRCFGAFSGGDDNELNIA
jgi:hypothetical protein